jgi:hypothetical protein
MRRAHVAAARGTPHLGPFSLCHGAPGLAPQATPCDASQFRKLVNASSRREGSRDGGLGWNLCTLCAGCVTVRVGGSGCIQKVNRYA